MFNLYSCIYFALEFPSPKTFFVDYVLGSLPVVFRSGARLSPAYKLWTDKHLSLRPEAQTYKVDVEVRKKEDRTQPTLRMTFAEFLKIYEEKDEYLVESLPKFLRFVEFVLHACSLYS